MLALASSGKRIPALALVGGLAGLATCGSFRLLVLLPEGFSESIGFIFGLFLCGHFWLFDETRSLWRALGFVGASTLAYLAAYNAGMPASNLWPARFDLLGLKPGEINVLLVGGFVGAAILFLALCFFSRGASRPPVSCCISESSWFPEVCWESSATRSAHHWV
jgi:hypothetical protein